MRRRGLSDDLNHVQHPHTHPSSSSTPTLYACALISLPRDLQRSVATHLSLDNLLRLSETCHPLLNLITLETKSLAIHWPGLQPPPRILSTTARSSSSSSLPSSASGKASSSMTPTIAGGREMGPGEAAASSSIVSTDSTSPVASSASITKEIASDVALALVQQACNCIASLLSRRIHVEELIVSDADILLPGILQALLPTNISPQPSSRNSQQRWSSLSKIIISTSHPLSTKYQFAATRGLYSKAIPDLTTLFQILTSSDEPPTEEEGVNMPIPSSNANAAAIGGGEAATSSSSSTSLSCAQAQDLFHPPAPSLDDQLHQLHLWHNGARGDRLDTETPKQDININHQQSLQLASCLSNGLLPNLRMLSLNRCELSGEVVSEIAKALAHGACPLLEDLDLGAVWMGNHGAESLADAFEKRAHFMMGGGGGGEGLTAATIRSNISSLAAAREEGGQEDDMVQSSSASFFSPPCRPLARLALGWWDGDDGQLGRLLQTPPCQALEELHLAQDIALTDAEIAVVEKWVRCGYGKRLRLLSIEASTEDPGELGQALGLVEALTMRTTKGVKEDGEQGEEKGPAPRNLEVLELRQCGLTQHAMLHISDAIRTGLWPHLRELRFCLCDLDPNDVTLLLNACTAAAASHLFAPSSSSSATSSPHRFSTSSSSSATTRSNGNPNLKVLELSGNHDIADDGFCRLAQALKHGLFPSLEELLLDSISMGDEGMAALTSAFNNDPGYLPTTLRRLSLSNSFMTYRSADALGNFIANGRLPRLQALYIDRPFGDQTDDFGTRGFQALVDALLLNKSPDLELLSLVASDIDRHAISSCLKKLLYIDAAPFTSSSAAEGLLRSTSSSPLPTVSASPSSSSLCASSSSTTSNSCLGSYNSGNSSDTTTTGIILPKLRCINLRGNGLGRGEEGENRKKRIGSWVEERRKRLIAWEAGPMEAVPKVEVLL